MLLSENRIAFECAIERTREEAKRLLDEAIIDVNKQLKLVHSEAIKEKKIENDAAVRTLQNENYDMKMKTKDLEKCMKESEKMSRDQEANWVRNEQQFLEEIEALRAEHEEMIKNEEIRNEKILQENILKATIEEKKLKTEFDEMNTRYEEELTTSRKSFNALELKWKRRESRAEDLSRIAFLEIDNAAKDELVAKTREEMMYIKREMINREENFNQKFGRSPMVSVVEVAKPGSEGGSDVMKRPPKPSTGSFGGGKPSKPSYTVGAGGSMMMSTVGGWGPLGASTGSLNVSNSNSSSSGQGRSGSGGGTGVGTGGGNGLGVGGGVGGGVGNGKTASARRLSLSS